MLLLVMVNESDGIHTCIPPYTSIRTYTYIQATTGTTASTSASIRRMGINPLLSANTMPVSLHTRMTTAATTTTAAAGGAGVCGGVIVGSDGQVIPLRSVCRAAAVAAMNTGMNR